MTSNAWIDIILMVSGVVGGAFINFFIIGRKVGQYEERIQHMEDIFIEKQAESNKKYDNLQDKVEEFIGQISYLEGKINGRRSQS